MLSESHDFRVLEIALFGEGRKKLELEMKNFAQATKHFSLLLSLAL